VHGRDYTLTLKDGRKLGYAEYGDPGGRPVFYFHGYPNSRLGAAPSDENARRRGLRVICLDRPGFGLSDFKKGRTIGSWPDDVAEAADLLGIQRFAVLGISGGGPYTAACAAKIPERITAAGLISGQGPMDKPEAMSGYKRRDRWNLALSRRLPFLVWFFVVFLMLGFRLFPALMMRLAVRMLPPADQEVLARPDVNAMVRADLREAFRQGPGAAYHEAKLYLNPWDFSIEAISKDMLLWHGEADTIVPVSEGRYMAKALPKCTAVFYPGEGHFMVVDHLDEINAALVAADAVNA
jgi:pimeloyl-ACP methyl ester carboxylesterase